MGEKAVRESAGKGRKKGEKNPESDPTPIARSHNWDTWRKKRGKETKRCVPLQEEKKRKKKNAARRVTTRFNLDIFILSRIECIQRNSEGKRKEG